MMRYTERSPTRESNPIESSSVWERALELRFDEIHAACVWHVGYCYAFHCERAENRVLVADLLLRIASGAPPRLDFVHVLELENDDAVRWGPATYRKGLIEPTSDVFAPIVIDGLLRPWEKSFL
jgi:hypothetical protein